MSKRSNPHMLAWIPRRHKRRSFVVLLVLLAIGATTFLSLRQQFFKPQALAGPTKITDENYEPTVNPFGDPWAWKKTSNPNIPVMASAPKNYINYQDPSGSILERHAHYLAKSNSPFMYFDSYEPQAEGQNPKSVALLNRVKQLNPSIKFLGYFVNHEAPPGYDVILQNANNNDPTFESFFVHKKNKPADKANRLYGRPDHPEWGFSPFMNITNPTYRAYVIPKIVASIRSAKMDGIMNDLLFYNITDMFNSPPASMPDNYIPDDIKAAWPGGLVAFIQELKAAMGPDLYLFANVDDDNPQFMQNDLLSPGRLDGVIFEDPFNARPDANALTKVTNLMNIVDSFGKKSILVVSGAYNGTTFSSSDSEQEKAAHRYFLAAYLMTLRSGNHMLMYYYPTSIFFQYNSESFFREWDLNLGAAPNGPENLGNGVYVRRFERGYVYWNPTNSNYVIQGGTGLLNIENGQDINGQIVPARSGAFFVTTGVFNEYNNPPASITPTLSPTISTKPGDINRDNAVNLLDYVILFENYGRNPLPDTRADLNKDGKVNILDYVILFENFGK